MRVRTAVSRQSNLSYSNNRTRRRNLSYRWREIEPVVNDQSGSSQRLTITGLQLIGMRITTGWNQASHSCHITNKSRGEITQRSVNGNDVDLRSVGRDLG